MAEPITILGAASFIAAVKAYCVAHHIAVSLPIITKCATAYLTGGKSAAISAAQSSNASYGFICALKDVL
ncbi:MAG: hypothetical protein F6K23_26790 [Okeania sp. SIO2C9]|uniref:hypothetical protein n=1 Tax=Okeania sp. SIO2C9 TaxID=2607791 RepID=UPI0013C21B48|nr:hypothetical protein [Okeania sp. SIO2C9]NEQ76329.1 hypothetical protein [Okeania sp. SIO2C9]